MLYIVTFYLYIHTKKMYSTLSTPQYELASSYIYELHLVTSHDHNLMWNAAFSSTIKCNRMLHFCIQYLIWVGMSWWSVPGANHHCIFFKKKNFQIIFYGWITFTAFHSRTVITPQMNHKFVWHLQSALYKNSICNLLNLAVMFSVVLLPLSSSSWVTATPSGAIRYRKRTVPSINQFIWKACWRPDKLKIPEIEAGVRASSVMYRISSVM